MKIGLLFFLFGQLNSIAMTVAGQVACSQQIQRLHGALWQYRRVEGAFPDHLERLIPQYVADRRSLTCPIVVSESGYSAHDSTQGVYEYQLEGVPLGPGVAKPHLASLARRRAFLFERSESSDVFSIWPLIRCPVEHSRLSPNGEVLNVDVDGDLFLSPSVWENRLEYKTELSRFLTLDVQQGAISDREHEFRSQGLALGTEPLNLTAYCNVTGRSSWFAGAIKPFLGSLVDSTLPEKGEFLSASNVPYFIENIVQLDRPPNNFHRHSLVGISVQRRARTIHMLVGGFFRSTGVDNGWGVSVKDSPQNVKLENFDLDIIVHFNDGDVTSQVKRIRWGEDFRCFFEVAERNKDEPLDTALMPSWSSNIDWNQDLDGLIVDELQDSKVYNSLYTVTVLNEYPGREIDSIDLVAPRASDEEIVVKPFVVAITLE